MANILKKFFELWAKKHWLVFIDREVERCRKLDARLTRQRYVVRCLVERYNELYSDDPIKHCEAKGEER